MPHHGTSNRASGTLTTRHTPVVGGNQHLVTAALIGVFVAACSKGDSRPTHALPDDGWRAGDGVLLAGPRGAFHATLILQGACAWMGDPSVPFSYSWPTGY